MLILLRMITLHFDLIIIYKKKSLAGLFLFGHGHGHTHSHDKEYEREEKKSSGEEDLIEQIKVMFFLF